MSNAPTENPDNWYVEGDDQTAQQGGGEAPTPAPEKIITEASGEGIVPLSVPKDRLRLLEYASKLEANGGEPTEKAFSARVWAQVSLPYKDPGSVPFWVRENGNVKLRVRPAAITDREGNDTVAYPFGIMPRHIMTWMATEAYRTDSRELTLGSSMNSFMEKLQIERGGQTRRRLRSQMERVFGSQLSVEGLVRGEAGQGYGQAKNFFQVTDSTRLWFSEKEEIDTEGLWDSKVILSDPFFQSIKDGPLVVDPHALRALGTKPLTFDIYVWVGHRLYSLEYATRMAWSDLHVQFGSQTKRLRDFRRDFIEALQSISIIMPSLRYELEAQYLVLYPGPTPIEQTSKRQNVRSNRHLRSVEPRKPE